jgi:hypothetical protein
MSCGHSDICVDHDNLRASAFYFWKVKTGLVLPAHRRQIDELTYPRQRIVFNCANVTAAGSTFHPSLICGQLTASGIDCRAAGEEIIGVGLGEGTT